MHPGLYGLYCAAWEGRVRGAADGAATAAPELTAASFEAGVAAAESPDAQLDFTARFKPDEMAQAEWDLLVDKVLNCVHACSLLAAKPRARQSSAATPGLYAGPCVLLLSDVGAREGVAAAVKRICPAVDAEQLRGAEDLLDPEALGGTIAALCRHVPRIRAAGAAAAEKKAEKKAEEEQAGGEASSSASASGARASSSSAPPAVKTVAADASKALAEKAVVPGGRREG